MTENRTERSRSLWEWAAGAVIIASLAVSSLGKSVPRPIKDFAGMVLLVTPLLLTILSWSRLDRAWRDGETRRWRAWISLAGCVTLSLALVVPFLVALLTLNWLTWSIACFGAGVAAVIAGIFAQRTLRFPLIFGGAIIVSLVVLTPIGIL